MEIKSEPFTELFAVKALAALAQGQRLRTFKALVVAGSEGLTPGAIALALGIPNSALSFHLKELTHSSLITCEPRGRNLIYRAEFSQMNALLGYLTEHCCQGVACVPNALGFCDPAIQTNSHTMTANATNSPLNVLFLCTHNSARSILAEAVLNHIGQGRFKGFSAGSSPRENQQPNPLGLRVLKSAGISTDGLSSKSWDDFGNPDAPHMDLVITVCDNAAGEVCPSGPGQPATAHWSYADPSAVPGTEEDRLEAFRQTLHAIRRRLELLVNLPAQSVDKLMLQTRARELAKS